MRPCKKTERVNGMAHGNMGENAGDQLNHLADYPPIDDAYEPFLAPEMIAAERLWRREVIGLMAWRQVPAKPRYCRNVSTVMRLGRYLEPQGMLRECGLREVHQTVRDCSCWILWLLQLRHPSKVSIAFSFLGNLTCAAFCFPAFPTCLSV